MRYNSISLLLVAFAVCANATFYTHDPKYCYSTDPLRLQLKMFSTTTRYDANRGSAYNPTFCLPKRIWFVSRHGSRYPSVADHDTLFSPNDTMRDDIIRNYEAGKTTLCPEDAKIIKAWQLNPIMLRTDAPADLSATGRVELINIARRYQRLFPGLLPKTYSQPHFFFRRSPLLRTLQTAQAFAEGLFGSPANLQVNYTGGSTPDYYMYSFGSCPDWMSVVYGAGYAEAQAFTQGQEFQEMITQVSDKLGFRGPDRLTVDQVTKLMTHCQYEQILNHDAPSPFCAAFSYDNVQVYEYQKDLQFGGISGYLVPQYRTLYKNMNFYLVQDMLNFLQATDDQIAKLSFGHDVTIQFLMVALGVFEDTVPLTANNYELQTFRKWRTSRITPMGSNLAVIRYDCIFGEDEVLFELNEKPLQIPGCDFTGVCKISVVLDRLSYYANGNCASLFCTN